MKDFNLPFHAGELAAQKRAGAEGIAERAAPFIRNYMPEQHRTFYEALPFLVMSSQDEDGRVWATVVEGDDGFIKSPDPQSLTLSTKVPPQDPLANALNAGADLGIIGIELATRRRNRLSGRSRATERGLAIDIRQTFGNCPKYINERAWTRSQEAEPLEPIKGSRLSPEHTKLISESDTLFIGTGRTGPYSVASNGFDASHRGGEPGFVQVISPTRLRIPDYPGNNFFNTIGNLLEDQRIGLVFIDFATGGLLHLSGRAKIDWSPDSKDDPSILRMIEVEIQTVLHRKGALSLRWSAAPYSRSRLTVSKKVVESEDIISFYLSSEFGEVLRPFKAGQHLPVLLNVGDQNSKLQRTYSLSGSPAEAHYRISVKREQHGVGSRFMHDHLQVGDVIEAKPPAGNFVAPKGERPLVLISAGVGLTPMLSMLHQIACEGGDRPVWYVHGTRNGRTLAFGREVNRLISVLPQAKQSLFFSAPGDGDQLGQTFDVTGRITADHLLALNAGPDAHYMLCGPLSFMTDLKSGLEAKGVPSEQIHFEVFGT